MERERYWCGNWRAVRAGDELLVLGACTFRTGGWTARIEVGNQGINPDPKYLRLDVKVEEPSGGVPEVISHHLAVFQTNDREAQRVDIEGKVVEVEDLAAGIGPQ